MRAINIKYYDLEGQYNITPDEDYDIFSYYRGLNLIKDFNIEIHYKGTEIENSYIKKVLDKRTNKVYAIENTGGLIADNKDIILLGDIHVFCRELDNKF